MDTKKIGERIHDARKEKNMTLQDIADDLGVARSTIQRYEKGLFDNIKLPFIEAIARSLGVNPSWLIYKSEIRESDYAVETYTPLEHLELLKAYQPSDEGYRIAMLFDKAGEDDKTIVRAALKKYEGLIPKSLFAGQPQVKRKSEKDEFMSMAENQFDLEKKQESEASSAKESDAV